MTPLGWLGRKTSTQTNKHLEVPGNDTLEMFHGEASELLHCIDFASNLPFSRANFHQIFKAETSGDSMYQNVYVAVHIYLSEHENV